MNLVAISIFSRISGLSKRFPEHLYEQRAHVNVRNVPTGNRNFGVDHQELGKVALRVRHMSFAQWRELVADPGFVDTAAVASV